MKKLIKKLWEKKDSKKGFTLVELIVVLVILAILAAIMIPSMIGWIDKAREKQSLLECRTYLLAAQTIASETYYTDPNAKKIEEDDVHDLAFPENADRTSGAITIVDGIVDTITDFKASDGHNYSYSKDNIPAQPDGSSQAVASGWTKGKEY